VTGSSSGPFSGPFSEPVDRAAVLARIGDHPIEGGPREQREAFARLVLGEGGDPGADGYDDGSVSLAGTGGTIVYLHGGGYAFGSPRTHERIGRTLAELTGLSVTLPAYPLAPEHVWPAQLNAAMAAVAAVAETSGPVVLAGDSAGAHLALVVGLEARRLGLDVVGVIVFSPNTDRTGLSTTRQRNGPSDPMVDDEGDRALARQCFGDRSDDDLQVSPVLGDLRLLPALHIEVGGGEVLLGDSLVLADAAREAGVPTTLHVEADGLHMMQLWTPWWSAATASLERAAAFALDVTASLDVRPDRAGS